MAATGAITAAQAQAPTPAPIEGPVHAVIYVEVLPTSRAAGLTALTRYRDAARTEAGNQRAEVLTRIGQSHQFVILQVWADQNAFEAHARAAGTIQAREQLQAMRSAPLDERVHAGLSVGPLQPGAGGDAVHVVTHVDVIPPRKDDGVAALRKLGAAGRTGAGNLRFEVVQQVNRPNHFTVIETWRDAAAVEAHAMAPATREFRDALGPISGALYDERMFKLLP
jgi:quinol monooxygenase YgiN